MEALDVRGLTFSYAGSSGKVLDDAAIVIKEGAFVVLAGNTGSGKSTLLRCVKREVAPAGEQSGSISVFGREVSGSELVPEAGFVFQDPESQIVCDSVWRELAFGMENVGLGKDVMRRRMAETCALFGIEGWLGRRTSELSGGQKQVLNLAAVVAMQPRILLLDEPTAQLDPVSAARFIDAVSRLNREFGMTVLAATHSPELFARCATDFYMLESGHVRRMDAPNPEYAPPPIPQGQDAVGATGCEGRAGALCPDEPRNPALSLNSAWFSYDEGATWALRDASASADEGAVVALVGANGSGKTTLLKIAAGILKPQRGSVDSLHRERQSYLPQDPRLLFVRDTVEEELLDWVPGNERSKARAEELAERLNLAGLLARNPLDLSGGQQQLLAFGKMLSSSPRLLLLDEPEKGMDAPSQLAVATAISDCSKGGATVVFSTHDMAFASRVATHVALLFDGEVTTMQPVAEFFGGNFYYRPMSNGFTRLFDASLEGADA